MRYFGIGDMYCHEKSWLPWVACMLCWRKIYWILVTERIVKASDTARVQQECIVKTRMFH